MGDVQVQYIRIYIQKILTNIIKKPLGQKSWNLCLESSSGSVNLLKIMGPGGK